MLWVAEKVKEYEAGNEEDISCFVMPPQGRQRSVNIYSLIRYKS